ncbi:MAG: AsmA-like C-terminal region-containing protein, partial [Acetobacteraceae bacterium]|nr:AsmA-like C-terminal region-containing protein [Acetobacteraceae bacterium]
EIEMNFKAGPPTELVQQAKMVARVGAAALKANGVDPGGVLVSGAAIVDARYAEQRDGKARVAVAADLGPVGLSIAGWHKAPGAAARAAGTVLLDHGKVTGVQHLSAEGPGMEVAARAEMAAGKPRILHVERVVLGPTRLAGEVVFPAGSSGPLRVRARGPVLDLSEQIGELTKGGSGSGGQDLIADVQFGRVMLGHGRNLVQLDAHVERIGGRLDALRATTGGAERLRASITPAPNGRRLRVEVADTGALLRGLELTSAIESGALTVDGNYDDRYADPPLAGRLQLRNFGVLDQVIVGKLLQAITIYGIPDAMRDKGVYFADLQVPFRFGENVLRLGQSRASSSSLGVTATGWVDFNRHLMDLNGTIVPAYAINSALGRLPWVGRLFSPERGGGLIAANFTVSGKTASPDVSVNPLSLLTPGLLRRLFDLFR